MFGWFRYYKCTYPELFLSSDDKSTNNSSETNLQQCSEYYRFGWLLFLALRIQTNSRSKNILTSKTELLLSIDLLHSIWSSYLHTGDGSCIGLCGMQL